MTTTATTEATPNTTETPKPRTRWSRFWRWFFEVEKDEAEHAHMEKQFAEMAEQSRKEHLDKVRTRVREQTYAQYIAQHPNDPDVHKTALGVSIKAAREYVERLYGT